MPLDKLKNQLRVYGFIKGKNTSYFKAGKQIALQLSFKNCIAENNTT